ncbi:flagellar hook-associated protein 3 FlgL [Sphingomonas jejuensis]|uniref:Flagellar hook-associated protein 3 FlgL n=1 Tax=Sphingomonas jejuensis TaxID=904715 RepID=A0ABX0XPZ6_9SPHN|nr:flagellar biosynthesis protein FlgL [Sphingomonas jejuensis]NJC34771.1 flagellar hook-associated protein 3 FlgL [Sphingomonas jejuensis]
MTVSIKSGTAHFFQRSTQQLTGLQAKADRLNTEIATGVRVTAPSVDPVASSRAAMLERLAADDGQYLANVKLASSLLDQSDAALSTMEINVQRARELAIRGASETLTPVDRRAIATELRAIVDDIYATANLSDARGAPLFGGAADGPAYTRAADGTISYAGAGEPAPLPIGDSSSIAAADSGQRLFGAIDTDANGDPRDMFKVLGDLVAVLENDALPEADRRTAMTDGLDGLGAITDRLAGARASIGARGARLQVEQGRIEDLAAERTSEAKALTGADLQQSIAELQQTMLILQAAQASFTKVSQLSLFDYIR